MSDVEVGIQRVYGLIKEGRLLVFESSDGIIGELQSYARKLDGNDQPTEEIEDKSTYHYLDALRYIATLVNPMLEGGVSDRAKRALSDL